MTNWKQFNITNRVDTKFLIKIFLDGEVYYGNRTDRAIYCEDIAPFIDWGVGDCLEIDLDGLSFKKQLDESANGIVRKISSATNISDTKKEIFRLQVELAKKNRINKNLARTLNSFYQRIKDKDFVVDHFGEHDFPEFNQKLSGLFEEFNELKWKSQTLEREKTNLESERDSLATERDDCKRKFNSKNRDYEDEKEKREELQKELDKLKNERINENKKNNDDKLKLIGENSQLKTEKTRAEEQLNAANNQVKDLTRRLESSNVELTGVKNQLEDTKNELSLVRVAKDNQEITLLTKIDQKQQSLETVRQSLADLRVENEREKAEKDSRLREKETELARKNEEIELLKRQGGLSHEELLNEKLSSEKGNLDLFASQLEINLEQIHSLTKYHERLFVARKARNQANIDIHEANIAGVKQEFSGRGINIINIREICQKCEKIAEFRWELEKQQQQYQAQQEQPANNI